MKNNKTSPNWIITKLGNLCAVVRGGSPRPMGDPKYFSGKIPFLKIADITKVCGKYVYDSATKVNELGVEKSRFLKKGSLILTNSGTVCVPKFLGVNACIHDGFVAFKDLIDGVDIDFLFHYFNYLRPFVVQKYKQGITQVNLNTEIVKNFDFPVPPLLEQKAIVEKLEQLFSELDKGVENLEKALEQLEIYRQAVLKEAFAGKLTEQWRKKQTGLPTAQTLLEQIKTQREEEAQKSGKKLKPIAPLSEAELAKLPPLPQGWSWIKSGELYSFITSGSRGWAKYYSENGAIFIRITNLDFDSLELDLTQDKIKYVMPPKGAEGQRTRVEEGDFLFSITGYLGMFAIAPKLDDAYVNQHISLCRPIDSFNKKFFGYWVIAKAGGNYYINQLQKGATKAGLGLDDIQNFPVPICSMEEQEQIVQQIEERLSNCDNLEKIIEESLKKTDALRQSILKKAFSGQLLSQPEITRLQNHPDWEPASTLLKRIQNHPPLPDGAPSP